VRKDVLQLYETKHCLLSKEHFVYYIGMLAKTEIHISVEEQKPILDSQRAPIDRHKTPEGKTQCSSELTVMWQETLVSKR